MRYSCVDRPPPVSSFSGLTFSSLSLLSCVLRPQASEPAVVVSSASPSPIPSPARIGEGDKGSPRVENKAPEREAPPQVPEEEGAQAGEEAEEGEVEEGEVSEMEEGEVEDDEEEEGERQAEVGERRPRPESPAEPVAKRQKEDPGLGQVSL